MSEFKQIRPEELQGNAFQMIGKKWMLVTAGNEEKTNTMTASWGGIGIMWNKPVAFVFIRPQRYTKEFVDNGSTLSLSFLNESFRKELTYLGSVSGRDEDKIAKAGLTVEKTDGTPYFTEADEVLICRKLYAQEMTPESFTDTSLVGKMYPENDFHIMYVAEIEKVLVK